MTSTSGFNMRDALATIGMNYTTNEDLLLKRLVAQCKLGDNDHVSISKLARAYVADLRADRDHVQLIDAFLLEYDLSTEEGLALMRLAEALIRTPDSQTSRLLMRDKLDGVDWSQHAGGSERFLVNQATSGLRITATWIKLSGGETAQNLAAKLGDQVLELAVKRAMAMMGEHFVLGRSIEEAAGKDRPATHHGSTYSYDMLGEAAQTSKDAERYFQSYLNAMEHLASRALPGQSILEAPGISVKLSALHPRYEYAKREDCIPALVAKVVELGKIAKTANLGLTIDAEEADRLEVSLLIFEHLLKTPELRDWDGLGLVIQAYQRRAADVIQTVVAAARDANRKIAIRLVKGAYWDMEIKRAQELGLESYPVFTRRENTDISYVACARLLLEASDTVFAQFATHNALTAATVLHMANDTAQFEFQRLHGMGEALHERLRDEAKISSRIYAPVGNHKDLLPYLVRRLLENGANSSFVNQLFDPDITIKEIIEDPFAKANENSLAAHPSITAPTDLFKGVRLSARGYDITQSSIAERVERLALSHSPYSATSIVDGQPVDGAVVEVMNPAAPSILVGTYSSAQPDIIDNAISSAWGSSWSTSTTPQSRAKCLETAANLLEERMDEFLTLCVLEAGKSPADAISEVREAIDFCRYYTHEAQLTSALSRKPLGTVACISPWNFPLAIFLGQIAASLSVGNTVIAKPAQQTPLISHLATKLMHTAGVPTDALHLILGDGALLGNYLTAHKDINGVCFTGSTATAKKIAANLASTSRSTLPFIAETGGINAMIIDSTALLEQAVQDTVASAFQSAGQRCSACRVVCVQDDIADAFCDMLAGAMQELETGNPALLTTDIGPVIDRAAQTTIANYVDEARGRHKLIYEAPASNSSDAGYFVRPIALELAALSDLDREIFGPVLHVVRFAAENFSQIVEDINELGYGLTLGLHSRIDSRVEWVAKQAHVGNLYVNRNQIGAVVGVQPFGGEGLSGTGPKAGGPHYLLRLSKASDVPAEATIDEETPALATVSTPAADEVRIKVGKSASAAWADRYDANARLSIALGALQQNHAALATQRQNIAPDQEIDLPGPTGETNALHLYPRGVILCVGDGDRLRRQMIMALGAGNAVIAVCSGSGLGETKRWAKAIKKETGLEDLVQIITPDRLSLYLGGDLDGVAVDGPLRQPIGEYLCRRDGPILPLLSAYSLPVRFSHERAVTINTTAAGGNASLLTIV